MKKFVLCLMALILAFQTIPVFATNLDNAVNYARTWAFDRNSDYASYSSDCANFVSQCIHAGGKAMTSDWHMYKILFWFDKTNTWTVARTLAIYANNNTSWTGTNYTEVPAAYLYPSYTSLVYTNIHKGALILYGWNSGDDGYHVAFVVSSDMFNGTTIASHTTDRLDAPYNYEGILTVAQRSTTLMQYINIVY